MLQERRDALQTQLTQIDTEIARLVKGRAQIEGAIAILDEQINESACVDAMCRITEPPNPVS